MTRTGLDTIGDVADDLARTMGVPVTLTQFVASGQILYLPCALACSDGKTRLPGVYVNHDAGRTALNGVAFANYGR